MTIRNEIQSLQTKITREKPEKSCKKRRCNLPECYVNEFYPAFISSLPPLRKHEFIQVRGGCRSSNFPTPSTRATECYFQPGHSEAEANIKGQTLDRSVRLRHRFALTSRFASPVCLNCTVEGWHFFSIAIIVIREKITKR